ncbi:MAG TPA: hypothetical protein ENI19_00565 [Candidatus Nealsonbacteria bacterium]|nr:hypothetical protein [Candidatus Nealsonbacteria bacterium]HEB46184.1 hypothetical protein [Candidatus Nealsonbacteria bacterium]
MPKKSEERKVIRIEGELSCPECRKPLKFIGDTLNYMYFECECPEEKMWVLLKTEELKEAYWSKQ